MTKVEQAIREFIQSLIEHAWETGNADSHECNTRFDDLRNLQNCVDNNLDDAIEKLTALISEHYISKEDVDAEVERRIEERMLTDEEIIGLALHYVSHKDLKPANRGLIKDAIIIGMKQLRSLLTDSSQKTEGGK